MQNSAGDAPTQRTPRNVKLLSISSDSETSACSCVSGECLAEKGELFHLYKTNVLDSEQRIVRDGDVTLVEEILSLTECSAHDDVASDSLPDVIVVPDHVKQMTNASLRLSLTQRGEQPGPVTPNTRRVYERKLTQLLRDATPTRSNKRTSDALDSLPTELQRLLRIDSKDDVTQDETQLLEKLTRDFAEPTPRNKWREGNEKKSFNYLLLDPRVTRNLPQRARSMSE